jgi:Domain of unknown function (DUF222)/HNH endonuclease
MDSNTHSTGKPTSPSTSEAAGLTDELAALTAAVDQLATQDLTSLAGATLAERILRLRRLVDRLEGHWLQELAAVDARGAAGADQGVQAPSTASWLRNRLHMGSGAATSSVRTARAVFRGPLTATATALTDGTISPAHASVLAHGTHDLPAHTAVEAEPVLLEVARRLDPPRLRRVIGHLQLVADPEGAEAKADRQHQQRGLWLSATLEGMVAVDGLLEAEAGQTLLAALEPLARPHTATDTRSGGQRRADALWELARRALEGGRLPRTGGVRPQLSVIVDLDSLQGRRGAVGGEVGWAGPLAPEGCRRLACDGAVTRVLVSRQPPSPHRHGDPDDHAGGPDDCCGPHGPDLRGHDSDGQGEQGLAERLQAAMALLPPILGGAPSQPLDLGRTTRVVTPTQRSALAVRDGGCGFPDCQRPLAWCEAHHLWHWLDGGPTDLANLILVCRAHHRAVHEGGWQLTRGPDGRLTADLSHRRHRPRPHRRHRVAA